jgi:redox-sensitive bicupin YhaK (pirin superfamily)
MIETRKIARVLKSKPTIEGAGVHLKRTFGFSQVSIFDPFSKNGSEKSWLVKTSS